MTHNDYTTVNKIKLDSNNQLKFQKVVTSSGKYLGDIRTFVDSQDYTGHTKKGLRFTLGQLKKLKNITSNINITEVKKSGLKIDQFEISNSSTIVVQIKNNKYTNHNPLIDIRKHIETDDYIGFTKNGFRFPPEDLDEFNNKLTKLIKELEDQNDDSAESTEDSSMVSKLKDEMM